MGDKLSNEGFRCRSDERYDMPVVFGPSQLPEVSIWGYLLSLDIRFETTYDAVRPFVPVELDVPAEPVVSFSRRSYDKVDYMAGRGYEELCVGVTVSHDDGLNQRPGVYWLVMWVDQVLPLIAGREISGFPKLGAEFPKIEVGENGWSFEVREFGSLLVRGSVSEATPLQPDAVQQLNKQTANATTYSSRYIPTVNGGNGVDQGTRAELTGEATTVYRGSGSVSIETPDWESAPGSARVVAALASLPVVQMRSAHVIEGRLSMNRSTVTAVKRSSVALPS